MNLPRITGCLLLAVLTLCPAAAIADEPYHVQVVLDVPDDPLFTRLYVNSLSRQVADQLAGYFGSLAEINVVTRHPVLEKLGRGRLRQLSLEAEEFATYEVKNKVFVVSLDFQQGAYHCGWRQLDGDARQLGAWHSRSTPDRQWLAKAICTCVRDDFAPVAEITPVVPVAGIDTHQVKLNFRGNWQPAHLQRWVGKGSVFQPYWIIRQRDGTLSHLPIPETVLRVTANDAVGEATVISKWENPWKKTPRLVGFLAMKVPTQSGRLRLHLVDADTGEPALHCQVYASSTDFGTQDNEHRLPAPDRNGWVTSTRLFDGLAYVRVSQGTSAFIEFPLPITDRLCQAVCRVPVDKAAAEKADFERRLRFVIQDVQAMRGTMNERVRASNELHDKKRYEEALKRVQDVVEALATGRESAEQTTADLKRRAAELEIGNSAQLTWLEGLLAEMNEGEQDLRKMAADLDTLIRTNEAQARADVQVNLGNQALKEGNIEDAIARYEFALAEQPNQPKLTKLVTDLKEQWRIKSPEHEEARNFVYEQWPAAEITELSALLPQAQRAFDTMKSVADGLGAARLVQANDRHLAALNDLLDQLSFGETDEDKRELEKYRTVIERMAEFQQQAVAFARDPKSTPPAAAPPNAATPNPPNPATTPPPATGKPPVEEEEEPPK